MELPDFVEVAKAFELLGVGGARVSVARKVITPVSHSMTPLIC